MDLNLTILGALAILVLFGVGESVYKKFKINRFFILIVLGLLILGLYVPNLKIKDVVLSISGFVLPAILSLIFAIKIRSFSFFINLLLMSFTTLILRLVFVDLEFIPLIIQVVSMIILGIVMALISKEPNSIIVASFIGYFAGNIIFELIKYSSITNFLASNMISLVLISQISAIVILYGKKKIKGKSFAKSRQTNAIS